MGDIFLPIVADLYVRVSTAEQAGEGYSIAEQEAKLRAYCAAMGYEVGRVAIDPGYSGANLDRPGIREVIEDAKEHKCNRVIVWKLDRLSRSQRDTMGLLEDVFLANEVGFISLSENFDTSTPIGRCMVGILSAFAQMEREGIRMRTMMGKEASARRGNWQGGFAPKGYRVAQDGGLEPDPQYADAVRELYQLSARGYGAIAAGKMVAERYGVSLAPPGLEGNLKRIIRNPVYKGMLAYHGELHPGEHEPLVTEEEWQAAVSALERRSEALPARRKVGILTGIIWCGRCGARMSAKRFGKRPHQYVCYSVSKICKIMVRDPACTNKAVHYIEDLDNAILGAIGTLAADPSVLDGMAAKREEPEAEAGRIRERLAEVARQSARLLDLYQAGGASMDDVRPRLEALQMERAALAGRLADAEAAKAKGEEALAEARDALGAWRELADGGTYEERVALVRALIDRVVIDGEDVTVYWRFSPDKSLNNS